MKNNILENRIGYIEISSQVIQDFEKDYMLPKTLFSNFFPVRIVDKFRAVEYYGYSKQFRETKDCEIVPKYSVIFETIINNSGKYYNIKFKEIKIN
jgi:hypothetical protein